MKIQPGERAVAGRGLTSRLARTDASLLDRADGARVQVLVKLDHDSVATYAGGLPGLGATSPAVTGHRLGWSSAEQAYEGYLARREQTFADELARRVPGAKLGQRLRTVYGGVTVTLPANKVKDLLALDEVIAVQRDELRQPLTDASAGFIGADKVQRQLDRSGSHTAGKGVIVGVLDTGAWPEHPSFADQGNLGAPPAKADGTKRKCDFGQGFKCNHKLIGGVAFLDSYLAANGGKETFKTARDSDGHGTHTASTSAGNHLDSAKVFGVERGPISGMAPGAWVSVYKVCGAEGCMSSDSAEAVAQAIKDGVDVINFSISGGTDPFADPVEMAFLDAYAAGVFVAASAGNSGPDAGTTNHLAPWVTTVAASTQQREFAASVTLTAGSDSKVLQGASLMGGVGPAPVVRGGKCTEPAKAGTYTGKIVVCERGVNARVEKGWNVKQGGAVGMILFNPALQDVETDNHWLPAVHLPDASLLPFLDGHSSVTATLSAGAKADGEGDVMAGFSSRGPAGLGLKPDVTAPGVQILAGQTPQPDEVAGGPKGELFQAIAGTSMSSPHVAGVAALLVAMHPDWTPGQVKSALMTTANTKVLKEDLKTPADPQDFGAGRITVDKAAKPGLTVSETAERMLQLANDDVHAVDLNLPSVNAPVMPGKLKTSRTFQNVTSEALSYKVTSTSSAVTVSPSVIVLQPKGSATVQITISSRATDKAWRFAEVRLSTSRSGYADLHLPVAYRPTQGRVTLASTCEPNKLRLWETAECQVRAANTGYEDTSVALSVTTDYSLQATTPTSREADLPGIKPGVPAVSAVDGRVFKSLGSQGVQADPIGDEEIINYDVPEFRFAGEKYTRIGVVSDGYLVVGGGTVQDVRYEPLPDVDASRPNNVLAPYWADLDGSADEGIRVATAKRDGRAWTVVEWRVTRFGTSDRLRFQVWLPQGDATDIRFAYDGAALPSGAQTFAVGAENALGQGVLTRKSPKEDLAVTAKGGKPGAVVTLAVTVKAVAPAADGALSVSMTTPEVPGTTVVRNVIPVAKPTS